MKKVISFVIFIIIGITVYNYRFDIINFFVSNFIIDKNIKLSEENNYYKNYDYGYVSRTDNFYPNNKQDILNIFYTILNNGVTDFSFYCEPKYKECINDVNNIVNDNNTLSYIDNLVHPFNSYDNLTVTTNNLGKVNVSISKLYSDFEIQLINEKVDEILKKIIKNNMTDKEKIKVIHDYIINNASYDQEFNNNSDNNKYRSHKAIGTLIEGKSICSGYSDSMAIFLSRLGINNYKIISDDHVWNYVNLDNKWYHLDLTWDDPVTDSGKNTLLHNFFLISTNELENLSNKLNTNHHNFNKDIYLETKQG